MSASGGDIAVEVVRHTERTMGIEELAAQLETGDLLFMCGNTLMARAIEWFGRTRFSHVCMVDRLDICSEYDPNTVIDQRHYLWESVYHADQCRCVIRQCATNGVRLVEYEDRMMALFNEYDPSVDAVCVAVVKLELLGADAEANARWRRQLADRLHAFQRQAAGRPYQLDVTALLQSRYSHLFGRAPREDRTVFCSELVMLSFGAMGLLPDSVDTNVSLTALSYDCPRLTLLHGARLRPRIDYYTVQRPPRLASAYMQLYHQPPPSPTPLLPQTTHCLASPVCSSPPPPLPPPLPHDINNTTPAATAFAAVMAAAMTVANTVPTSSALSDLHSPSPASTVPSAVATLVRAKKVHLS